MANPLRHIAVIIGINQYGQGIPPLQTAVNDAQALANLLTQEHHYQTHLFLDEQASRSALYELLEKTLPDLVQGEKATQGGEASRLLFYFAGHGIALNGEDGPEGYLIPQDAKLGETASYLPMTYLQRALEQLPCRHFLGILDCCFAGAFRWSGTRDLVAVPEVLHQEHYEHLLEEPAWQVLTSAAYDQKALDVSPFAPDRACLGQHSPFALALLEALRGKADLYPPATQESRGNGVITATELYLYLRDRLATISSQSKHQQTPGLWPLKKHDKGEYIFLNPQKSLHLTPAPVLDASHNPYRGLQSFEEEHSHLFFGRNPLVKKLYGFVESHPLTVVLGVSGRGKSSLVKAGLIPYIKQNYPDQWHIFSPIRLGCEPLASLKRELSWEKLTQGEQFSSSPALAPRSLLFAAPLLAPPLVESDSPQPLSPQIPAFIDQLGEWLYRHFPQKLLLIIDQFEELVTLGYPDAEREQVLSYMIKLLSLYPRQIRLVVTLRSDF
ncbi:MAG: caspase family protein, partial [Microcystaceae cyanobacterium]